MKHTIRKTITTILTGALLLSAVIMPMSAKKTSSTDSVKVTVNGELVDFPDQKPVIKNSRTLVPIRFIAESLGCEVDWNEKDNSVLIDDGRIVMYIGTNMAEIDGKPVKLDAASESINDRTMVPLRVIAETLDCTVDWLAPVNTVQVNAKNADGTEKSIWDRLIGSGMFTLNEDFASGYYGCAVLGDNFNTSKVPSWYITRNINLLNNNPEYDCELYVKRFDKQTLSELRDMLMIIYPNDYDMVYNLMLQSIKGELWECLRENAGYLASGTWGTHYVDNREVSIYAAYGLSYMIVTINKEGYINPETPMQLTNEQIKDMTTEAKKFYPLKDYGLD